jgi:HEAT repeat protein
VPHVFAQNGFNRGSLLKNMWKLSETTEEIVRQLYEADKGQSWFRSTTRDHAICDLLARLADAAEYRTVACAARFLFSPSPSVRQSAFKTIAALMGHVSPIRLLQTGDAFGASYGWYVNHQWDYLPSSKVLTLATDESNRVNSYVLGLASSHRNGYVRHEAVRLLSAISDGTELPFLLIRQNDWVRLIAVDAQDAIERRISDGYLPHLVRSLPLILHLSSFSRYDHSGIVRKILGIILKDQHDAILREAVESSDRVVRRKIVRVGLALQGSHQFRLMRHALHSSDPIVRLAACRHLAQVNDDGLLVDLLGRLQSDLSMPVRREALRLHAERFPSQAKETWRKALLDRSYSIRELARFELQRLGTFDAAGFYRQAVSEYPKCFAAVEGLAETADSSDVPFLKVLLTHRFPTRRFAAVRGLGRVGGESAVSELVQSLRDVNPRVVREARRSLQSHLGSVQGEVLLAVALEAQQTYARHTAISMIADMGKWRSLPWLIKAASTDDNNTAGFAAQMIEDWFTPPKCNRVFTRPSSDEANLIRDALTESKGRLPQRVINILELDGSIR